MTQLELVEYEFLMFLKFSIYKQWQIAYNGKILKAS